MVVLGDEMFGHHKVLRGLERKRCEGLLSGGSWGGMFGH